MANPRRPVTAARQRLIGRHKILAAAVGSGGLLASLALAYHKRQAHIARRGTAGTPSSVASANGADPRVFAARELEAWDHRLPGLAQGDLPEAARAPPVPPDRLAKAREPPTMTALANVAAPNARCIVASRVRAGVTRR